MQKARDHDQFNRDRPAWRRKVAHLVVAPGETRSSAREALRARIAEEDEDYEQHENTKGKVLLTKKTLQAIPLVVGLVEQ